MPIRLPRFERTIPITEEIRTPTLTFHQWWDKVAKTLETVFNDLEAAVLNIQAAMNAATTAQAAAATAQTAANTAQAAANSATGLTSVINSGTSVNPLSSTDAGPDATIVIAGHNRLYPNGTSVAVTGASLTGRAYSTEYWVYYDDPARTGGAVSFQSTTTEATAAQAGDRHLVGKVTTPAPAAPDTNGEYKRYPGLELTL